MAATPGGVDPREERDRHRMGAHAVARDTTAAWEALDKGGP